ncbi:MAG: M48 family metallopeptidase [Candidatus Woesearchaeota archaeon]
MRISFDEVRQNKLFSFLLVAVFFIIIGILGVILGILLFEDAPTGIILALIVGGIYGAVMYTIGDAMILGISGAKPVTKKEYPYLYHTIEAVAIAANIPTPKAYVIQSPVLNAFATGRDPKSGSVAVTTGLLEKLNRQELEGVIAHEIAHIKHYDIRLMLLATVLVGVVVLLSDIMLRTFIFSGMSGRAQGGQRGGGTAIIIIVGIVLAILAPIFAYLLKLAISRKREYAADAAAVSFTRYPAGLAGALKKIQKEAHPEFKQANHATEHMFIANPFRKQKRSWSNLFSTHPPLEERIRRLEEM